MLEEKLRNVKDKLADKLEQGELTETDYWQTTYDFLVKEDIIDFEYEDDDKYFTVKIATKLLSKIPAQEYWGLKSRYIALVGKELSEQSQEDLRKYSELERSTLDHLRNEIGDSSILELKYVSMVEDYLMNHTELPNIASEQKQREAITRIKTSLRRSFNVTENPHKIGVYDMRELESAFDKL